MESCEAGLERMEVEEEGGQEEAESGLASLPTELLLHILQFLEVRFITGVLAQVSRQFARLASDETTWRLRVCERWPGQYPPCPAPPAFCWARAAAAREEETAVWAEQRGVANIVTCPTAHYSSVDCVRVLRDSVVVSGSRDRGINLWTTAGLEAGQSSPTSRLPDAHKGWVWSFSSPQQDQAGQLDLVSGSWDNTVKFWQLSSTALEECRKPVNLRVAVLCTDIHQQRVAAGTYDKKVIMLDAREDVKKMTFYRCHSKPVLAVRVTERHVLSLSEDQTLVVYDRAAGKRYKKVPIPGRSFPLCMSIHHNSLYVGDKAGGLHLIDMAEDRFEVVQQYSTGHSGKLTSVQAGLGSLLTAGSDGDIRVFQPDRSLQQIEVIKNPDCGEVAEISHSRSLLAAAFSNNTVKIWTKNKIAL